MSASTTDAQITADLAIVRRASGERLVPLEATLRAVGAVPTVQRDADASLAVMSRLYSLRVARMATGLVVISFVVARLIHALIPGAPVHGGSLVIDVLWEYSGSLVRVLGPLAVVYVAAAQWAARAFAREVGASADARARARSLVLRVDRWSTALAIAGAMTFAVADLGNRFLFSGASLLWLNSVGTPAWTEQQALLYAIPIVAPIIASWLAAVVIARGKERRVSGWLVAAMATAVLVGLAITDVSSDLPTLANMVAFGVTMVVLFIAIAGFVLGRRARENASLDGKEPS